MSTRAKLNGSHNCCDQRGPSASVNVLAVNSRSPIASDVTWTFDINAIVQRRVALNAPSRTVCWAAYAEIALDGRKTRRQL